MVVFSCLKHGIVKELFLWYDKIGTINIENIIGIWFSTKETSQATLGSFE
jgi:hypothetical protein